MKKNINEELFKQELSKDKIPIDKIASLEAEYYENEYKRKENFRKNFSFILITALWISSGIILSMAVVWFWHLLSPDYWHFLTLQRVHEIQNMLFAGLVSQAIPYISSYLKKQN